MSNKVKRAIIMAAGLGKRMQPLTLDVPKPLIEVNGTRMIESVIQGLNMNGINEIHVVTGHLKEKFNFLIKKYPGVDLIENPYYAECNNISSLYVARDYLEDCIILDGDQIIYNPDILNPEFELSGYNAVWCESETNEWLMQVEGGMVISCSRTGGSRGWKLYSISRWSHDDGKRLKDHVEYEFERGNRDIYWDDVAMFCHFKDYKLGIREMKECDIAELDNINELILVDPSYEMYNDIAKQHDREEHYHE